MAKQIQKGSSKKKLQRSARHAPHHKAQRPTRVARARKRHLKNALRSNGEAFAASLRARYQRNLVPGPKVHERLKLEKA